MTDLVFIYEEIESADSEERLARAFDIIFTILTSADKESSSVANNHKVISSLDYDYKR